jgi:putative endonuclease
MAGLDPAILFRRHRYHGWMAVLHDQPAHGVLYAGVSADMPRRVWEHKQGMIEGFTQHFGLTRLVYYEWYDRIIDAIQREKNIKHWKRAWKIELIEKMNPNWDDLYDTLNR